MEMGAAPDAPASGRCLEPSSDVIGRMVQVHARGDARECLTFTPEH
ncbi:hypothetical protein [Methylobacterium haplocladii]|nr:hypothetical protein [Methylobacterium haplocladii]GJD82685.1 hypothetical protein HPGCJGGD_0544 [Methylobacterium haplocladii]